MDDLLISIGHVGRDYPMLATCLRSVFEEDAPGFRYRVRVVYNGPDRPGATAELERDFPQVEVLYQPGPLGFCLTHNLVLRDCDARYALVLDDDTVVRKGALSKMVAFMDAHPRVGMAGCLTLDPDGSFQPSWGLLLSLGAEFRSIFTKDVYTPRRLYADRGAVQEVPYLNGSFMLVRAETLREVGVLDEHYYTYLCEADWAYRMTRAGWSVKFVPDAEIVHVGGAHSIRTAAKQPAHIVRGYANRFYWFRKHRSRIAYELLRPIALLTCASRMVHYALVHRLRPGAREVARMRLEGYRRVVRLCFRREPHVLPPELAAP